MPRLIDDLRAATRLMMPWHIAPSKQHQWTAHAQRVMKLLDLPMPVVLIDNVSDYYFTGTDQEQWNLAQHFPNMAPPWPLAFFEHRMPRTIHSKECGDSKMEMVGPHARAGFLVFGTERAQIEVKGEMPDNLHWVLSIEMFFDWGWRTGVEGCAGTWCIALDKEGQIIGDPWVQTYAAAEYNDAVRLNQSFMHPTLLAISFMHCRNVQVLDNAVSPPLAKKYAARHGGVKPTEYKTLVIEPLKQILRREGNADKTGIAHAMHICRGHLRDYREGKGLFGKYHQLVWTPSIVRGTKGKAEDVPAREVVVKI